MTGTHNPFVHSYRHVQSIDNRMSIMDKHIGHPHAPWLITAVPDFTTPGMSLTKTVLKVSQ